MRNGLWVCNWDDVGCVNEKECVSVQVNRMCVCVNEKGCVGV